MFSEDESVRRLLRRRGVLGLPNDCVQLHQAIGWEGRLGQERGQAEVKLISWPNLEHEVFRIHEVMEYFSKFVDKDTSLDYGQLGAGRDTW